MVVVCGGVEDVVVCMVYVFGILFCIMISNVEVVFVFGVWGLYYNVMVFGMWFNEGGQLVVGVVIDYLLMLYLVIL